VEQSGDGRGLDLVFRSIRTEDGGEYSCEAVIDGKKEQQFFSLNVIGKKLLFVFFVPRLFHVLPNRGRVT
jgi:hypothetical protein